jgi:hypothetical protein
MQLSGARRVPRELDRSHTGSSQTASPSQSPLTGALPVFGQPGMDLGYAILRQRRVPIIVEQPRLHETFLPLSRSIP